MRTDMVTRLEQAARLRDAREKAGFKKPTDAIERFRWKTSTYMANENGQNGLTSARALEYGKAYGVDPGWLLTGVGRGPSSLAPASAPTGVVSDQQPEVTPPYSHEGPTIDKDLTEQAINLQKLSRDVPILGAAACGDDGMFELNGQTIDYAKRWPRLVGIKDLYALFAIGDSMYPWREHGEIVYVSPHQPVHVGDHIVVQLVDDGDHHSAAYIKRLDRRTEKELRLFQYNPAETLAIPMKRVKSIHRVIPWKELNA